MCGCERVYECVIDLDVVRVCVCICLLVCVYMFSLLMVYSCIYVCMYVCFFTGIWVAESAVGCAPVFNVCIYVYLSE